MRKKGQQKKGQCVYCGHNDFITKDHIPPKELFISPRPNNLITVPSCEKCRRVSTASDEYFKLALILREDVSDHPDVRELLPSVLRSLRYPHNVPLKVGLLKTFRLVNPRTPSGLLLSEKKHAYYPNINRLERVIERMTKGFFYHEKGYRLPDGYEAVGFSPDRFNLADDKSLKFWRTRLIGPVSAQRPKILGNDVFSYKFLCDSTDPNSSVWLFLFYKQVPFIGLTLPHETAQQVLTSTWSINP